MGADDDASGHNASALAKALAAMMGPPWAVCFIAYSIMHRTYPLDRRRVATLVWTRPPPGSTPTVPGEADGVSLVRNAATAAAAGGPAAVHASVHARPKTLRV